jgi:hypothetical protein
VSQTEVGANVEHPVPVLQLVNGKTVDKLEHDDAIQTNAIIIHQAGNGAA